MNRVFSGESPRISAFPKCYLDAITTGEMPLSHWIESSRSLGADGLEMYVPWLALGDEAALESVRAEIEKTGQVCSLLCASPDFTHPDAAHRAEEVRREQLAIQAAATLGATRCRVLSGQRRPDVSRADGVRWTVACIEECLETAEAAGVVLAMENHYKDAAWRYPEFAQRGEIFLEIVAQIDSQWFGVQYDPSNALVAGEDPVAFLDSVLPRVVSMHASDRYLKDDACLESMREADGTLGYPHGLCHGEVGKGINDYDAIFRRLAAVDYSGWISIEDGENGMDEMRRSVEFLRARVAEHYGG